MAKILLNSGNKGIAANDGDRIFGTDGAGEERAIINSNLTGVTVNQHIERVDLAGNPADYTYQHGVNTLNVYSKGHLVATISVQDDEGATAGTELAFAGGSTFVKMGADNSMTLGGAAIPADKAGAVVPTTPLDETHKSEIGGGDTPTPPTPGEGNTFTLTTGLDNFDKSAYTESVTFDAPLVGAASSEKITLNPFDTLKGGSAVDTLNATFNAEVTTLSNVRVDGVENINFTTDNAFEASLNHWGGVQKVNVASIGTAAKNVTLTSKATDVSVLGGSGVAINDTAASTTVGSNLKTVSVDGASDNIAVIGNAVSDVAVANHAGSGNSLTVTNTTADHALNLTVDNINNGTASDFFTVTDGDAGVVSIKAVGKESMLNATFAKATALHIDADENLTIDTLTNGGTATLKTIDITGDSLVTISAMTTVAALASIDAGTMTAGGVTITPALATGVAFTGGAGNDSITVAGSTKAIKMGAGDDKVTISAVLGVGATVDGGTSAGDKDVIAFTNSTHLTAATAKQISGFEILNVSGTTNVEYDFSAIAGLKELQIGTATSMTINNLVGTATVVGAETLTSTDVLITGKQSTSLTLGIKDATTSGHIDTVHMTVDDGLAGVHTIEIIAPTLAGVEKLHLTAIDNISVDTLTGAAKLMSITLDGAGTHSLTTGGTAFALNSVIDARAADGAVAINASAATTNGISIHGSLTAMNTLKGGEGGDAITVGSGGSEITGGKGNDIITLGAGKDTVIFSTVANNGTDTIHNFTSGVTAGHDIVALANGDTTVATGSGSAAVFTSQEWALTDSSITLGNAAAGNDVIEITTVLSAKGDLSSTVTADGTELLKALSSSDTASTGLTVASGDKCYLVAYQGGKAYLYQADAGSTAPTTISAGEILLVGVFDNVAHGAFDAADFVMA